VTRRNHELDGRLHQTTDCSPLDRPFAACSRTAKFDIYDRELSSVNLDLWMPIGRIRSLPGGQKREGERRVILSSKDTSESSSNLDSVGGILIHPETGQAFRMRTQNCNPPKRPVIMTSGSHHATLSSEVRFAPVASDPQMRDITLSPRVSKSACGAIDKFGVPSDARARISGGSMASYPNRALTRIEARFLYNGQEYGGRYGSGVFVGPKHVLTAAHNCYDCIGDVCGQTGDIWHAYFRNSKMESTAQWVWVHPNWFEGNTETSVDYGMLVLREQGTYSPGAWGMISGPDSIIKSPTLAGFPGESTFCKAAPFPEPGCEPWGWCDGRCYRMVVNVTNRKKEVLWGKSHSQGGQSGGPWYMDISGARYVCGVHALGDAVETVVAKRLTANSLHNLCAVMKDFPHSYWKTPSGC